MPNTEKYTSRYKTGRVPVIALDYSSRQLAEKRELLIDYKNAKLYVVSAEDKTVIYDITEKIFEKFEESGDISNFVVKIEGLGIYNLGETITQLFHSKIDLIEDKEFRYFAPTSSFDNNSIAMYNNQASIVNFPSAADGSVPVKKNGYIIWEDFDIETLIEKIKHLEKIAPPDDNEFTKFRERLNAIELTAELYKELPGYKEKINNNLSKILLLEKKFLELNKIKTIQEDISSVLNTVKTNSFKIKNAEANIDILTNKVNEDNSTLNFLQERANTNAALMTDLTLRTTKLENINTKDRLYALENNLNNILNSIRGIASSETISNLDDRVTLIENKIKNIDINKTEIDKLRNSISSLNNDFPEIKSKLSNFEKNYTTYDSVTTKINELLSPVSNSVTEISTNFNNFSKSIKDQFKGLNSDIKTFNIKLNNLETDLNSNFMPIRGGTFTGEVTGPAFHGVADSAITIKDINNKEPVYGYSRILITDKNGNINTIDGVKFEKDSLTLPLKLYVDNVYFKKTDRDGNSDDGFELKQKDMETIFKNIDFNNNLPNNSDDYYCLCINAKTKCLAISNRTFG